MMRGNRASADTFLTGKMRQAGLNLMGRTTTPEFGVCSSAENPAVYVTRNPWNPEYTSYGSSAGTAVALAAGRGVGWLALQPSRPSVAVSSVRNVFSGETRALSAMSGDYCAVVAGAVESEGGFGPKVRATAAATSATGSSRTAGFQAPPLSTEIWTDMALGVIRKGT